jgi:ABC-type Na+ transport system ATPase subunit NatA
MKITILGFNRSRYAKRVRETLAHLSEREKTYRRESHGFTIHQIGRKNWLERAEAVAATAKLICDMVNLLKVPCSQEQS